MSKFSMSGVEAMHGGTWGWWDTCSQSVKGLDCPMEKYGKAWEVLARDLQDQICVLET